MQTCGGVYTDHKQRFSLAAMETVLGSNVQQDGLLSGIKKATNGSSGLLPAVEYAKIERENAILLERLCMIARPRSLYIKPKTFQWVCGTWAQHSPARRHPPSADACWC